MPLARRPSTATAARHGPLPWSLSLLLSAALLAALVAGGGGGAGPPTAARRLLSAGSEAAPGTRGEYDLSWPLAGWEWGLFIVCAVSMFLASGAGVGGGLLLMPALTAVAGFGITPAVALSNLAIAAASVANVICNAFKRHPLRRGPVVDWDLTLMLSQTTILGSIIGSIINVLLPSYITDILLFVFMIPTTWRLVKKALVMWKADSAPAAPAPDEAVAAEPGAGADAAGAPPPAAAGAPRAAGGGSGSGLLKRGSAGSVGGSGTARGASLELDPRTIEWLRKRSSVEEQLLDARLQEIAGAADAADAAAGADAAGAAPAAPAAAVAASRAAGAANGAGEADAESAGGGQPAAGQLRRRLAGVLREEASPLPPYHIALLAAGFAALLASRLAAALAVPCGGAAYWLITAALVPALLGVWLLARRHVLAKMRVLAAAAAAGIDEDYVAPDAAGCCSGSRRGSGGRGDGADAEAGIAEAERRREKEWGEMGGDQRAEALRGALRRKGRVEWSGRNTLVLPLSCIAAGVIAGLLGLGGGIVLAPLMLELAVHPQVTVATSQLAILISSSAATVSFAAQGRIPAAYGVALAAVGFAATLAGQIVIDWAVKRLGKSSLLVVILAVMCTVGTAAAAYVAVASIVGVARQPALARAAGAICGG